MNELVTIKDNQIILAEESIKKIKQFQKTKLQIDLLEKELKESLKQAMKKCGIKQFIANGIYADITQVKGRATIDTKRLKEELPDVAEKYTKVGEPTEKFTFKIVEE